MPCIRRLQRTGLAIFAAVAMSAAGHFPAAAQVAPAPTDATTTTTTTAATPTPTPATTPGGATPIPAPPTGATGNATATAGTTTGPSEADQTPDRDIYPKMFRTLFILFVLAVVLESALALIFNWRPFLLNFDGRGVRSVISFALALVIALALKLDVVEEVYEAWNGTARNYNLHGVGYFLTALVIAGGSAGVNTLLRALGFRSLTQREDVAPKPPKDHAWLAVRVRRRPGMDAPVNVFIQQDGGKDQLVGVISGLRSPTGLFRWFLTDKARFPIVGGITLDGGQTYVVRLEGKDNDGVTHSAVWGANTIAKGAIIDLDLWLPEKA